MRDLGEMIQRVRRKCGDYADTFIGDPVIESALEVAADQVWDDLLEDEDGKECLRTYSEPTYLVAGIEEYELPERCMWLRSVEYRNSPGEQRWTPLTRKPTPEGPVMRDGTAILFGGSAQGGETPMSWADDAPAGYIRVWPGLQTVNGQQIRFVYYRRPRFPQYPTATFNNPDAYSEAEANLPERVTEAVEWGAAIELASDNTGAAVSLELASQSYYRALRTVKRTANKTAPVRRYIKRVNADG